MNSLINDGIDKALSNLYKERVDAIRHIVKIKTFKEKSDFFSNVRNTLLNTALTTKESSIKMPYLIFFPKEQLQVENWDKALSLGLFFPKKND